jgi:protein-S-isoprenylcysteine O-methyltransferase Ste14
MPSSAANARAFGLHQRLQGFLASAAVAVVAGLAYRYAPFAYHRRQFAQLYGPEGFVFTAGQYLFWFGALYLALLGIYFATTRDARPAKALRALRLALALARSPATALRKGLTPEDRLAVGVTLLKAFFGPMMAMSLLGFGQSALIVSASLLDPAAYGKPFLAFLGDHAFWLVLKLALFIDVFFFTVGYLVESPRLRNEIRSVDTSLLGCAAALMCYPPFNVVTGFLLGSNVSDFPQFDDPMVHASLNVLLLSLMLVYAWATVALAWKSSNLTHRGIIGHGPYRFVRHPAYVSKNIAWWIGSIPWFTQAFAESWLGGVQALASMTGWSMIYLLRALTEEDHLRRVDGDYAAYARHVRWRFIPGVV